MPKPLSHRDELGSETEFCSRELRPPVDATITPRWHGRRQPLGTRRLAASSLGVLLLFATAVGVLAVPRLRWESVLAARKAIGLLPNVTWSDLRDITRPSLGFRLRHLARYGDPYSTIHDPVLSAADRARGQVAFEQTCARCHGAEAHGGLGPALVGRPLAHGDSDWALYRTITRGVPGTPMQGGFLKRADVWPVIAYLRRLGSQPGRPRTDIQQPVETGLGEVPLAGYQQLVQSAGQVGQWELPAGGYDAQRFARDTEINAGNVAGLAVHWLHQFPSATQPSEATPIVVGNYMYVSRPPANVYALDARTGKELWHFARPIPGDVRLCCVAANRGVAVLGQRVYLGTLDAHLLALDARTGALIWDQTVADYRQGYSITSAPLPVRDLVITGLAGGEFPTRGSISAYDAATGQLRWRFNTIPGPGHPGHETWRGESWKTGGGATYGSGAYDPNLGLVYWGVGTAAPDFNAALRPGDNLYANCLLALDAKTGRLAWYFQFLPGDDHDWDSIQTPALIDLPGSSGVQHLLAVANRGGFFYVLDRLTGRFVRGAPFAKQTWARGLSASGRPIRTPDSDPSPNGTLVYPSSNGATNWWPSAYSPLTGLYYVNVEEGGGLYFSSEHASSNGYFVGGSASYSNSFSDLVRAIDLRTAQVRWERRNTVVTSSPRGGLLATAGGLLFGSDGTTFYALDAMTGHQLWSFDAGAHIAAPPMTFRSAGQQLVVVMAGQDLLAFGLPHP